VTFRALCIDKSQIKIDGEIASEIKSPNSVGCVYQVRQSPMENKMRIIKQMKFEVVGSCQNHCFSCAHDDMISTYKGYQLSLEELSHFVDCTKVSDYFIEVLHIHGIGEPLLWKHFNTGVKVLKESGSIGKIIVYTNGYLMDRIDDTGWTSIDSVVVSLYPGYKNIALLNELKNKYNDKIYINHARTFNAKLLKGYINRIPCFCGCSGPMFVKDKLFRYCGPPVFDAAKLMGISIFDQHNLYLEMRPNYLDDYDEKKIGNMELCNYCWANTNIHSPAYPWGYEPSRMVLRIESWFADTFYRYKIIPRSVWAQINNINVALKSLIMKFTPK